MSAIRMSGTGEIKSRPDLAVIGVAVQTQDKKSSTARRDNNDTMEKLMSAVRVIGINPKDMQTIGYRLWEATEHVSKGRLKGKTIKVGFAVQNTLVIKLRDLDKVDDVLDALADAGATTISGPNFTVANPAELRDKARKLAFERAKAKAELYCRLAGMKIVGLLKLDEGRANSRSFDRVLSSRSRVMYDRMGDWNDESQGGEHIAVGEEEVAVTVNCKFKIAPLDTRGTASTGTRGAR